MKHATHFTLQPGWRLLLTDMGVDPAQVLRLANLPADLFLRPDVTVAPAQFFELWHAIEHVSGDAHTLPLTIGQAISVEAFDPPIFSSLCSPNLNVAYQRLATFKRLIAPMTLTVDITARQTSVTLQCYAHVGTIPHSLAMTEMVFLTALVRLATRHRIIPREVILPELPGPIERYTEYFGIRPKNGKTIRVSFSKEDSLRPFLTANEPMWAFFEAGLRQRLATLDLTATMSDRVKAVLLEGIPAGQCTVEDVAKQLAVSKRSLQRQLSEESSTFKAILNATRQQLALHYLNKPAIRQAEIGFLLGFQDVNSFIRAFKGWQGITPGAYRHGAQGNERAPT